MPLAGWGLSCHCPSLALVPAGCLPRRSSWKLFMPGRPHDLRGAVVGVLIKGALGHLETHSPSSRPGRGKHWGRVPREPGPPVPDASLPVRSSRTAAPGPALHPGLVRPLSPSGPGRRRVCGPARAATLWPCAPPHTVAPRSGAGGGCFACPGTLNCLKRSFSLKSRPVSHQQDTWGLRVSSSSHVVPAGHGLGQLH